MVSGRTLSDALLANYITTLHETGKSPATIGQVVAAVKWQLKHQSQESVNFPITQATLAGIRREGKDRGRGQVDGLIGKMWKGSVFMRKPKARSQAYEMPL